ncbi:MAG: aldo/keto reductase [Phycisphaerales bacterium]|nr:aldo/keto reductase [Phycisphaerales bacterium]
MAPMIGSVSPIGFGAFKIGRNQGTKYQQSYDLPDDPTVQALLNGVLDLGINYIDTAPAYGLSEERIGLAISHRRSEFSLSTKVGESFDDGVSSYDFSEKVVRQSVEQSLRRLRTDVLDMVFIHAGRDDLRIVRQTDAARTLMSLRDAGLIRAIGLSGHTLEGLRAAMPWADALMLEYHGDDTTLEPIVAEAAARGLTVVVKKGLASGRLPPVDAIGFILNNPGVASLVVGSLSLHHMRENLRIAMQVPGRERPRWSV